MPDDQCFARISSENDLETERKLRVRHRGTGHVYEFQLARIEAGLVLELKTAVQANPNSIINPVEKQVAARLAARQIIKEYESQHGLF